MTGKDQHMESNTIMRMTDFKVCKHFLYAFGISVCLATGCGLSERDIVVPDRTPEDTGIYDLADLPQPGDFCPPVFVENANGCWKQEVDPFIDCHHDSLFNRFGNGWTGADATYSIMLPDGRTAWLFGDTFLGTVNPDYTRPGGIPFINNSIVLTRQSSFKTLYGGTEAQPKAFVEPPEAADWYWPHDPTIHDGKMQLLLAHMGSSGSGGMWDFRLESIDLAIISLADFSIESLEVLVDSDKVYWGAAVMEDDDYTYIYGIEDGNLNKYVQVARVAGGDLTSPWEYYNGTDWQDEPAEHRIKDATSNQFSVFKNSGKYYLMTQEIIFGTQLFLFESDSPVGPWQNQRTIYCTQESGGDIFTYNAFVHPEQSIDNDLFITYNVNSFDFGDLFEDVRNYRPRFVRVQNWK